MAQQPRDSVGSLGALGPTIKLNPPAPIGVTVENFPDWSWKMTKYLGLQDSLLPSFLTELETQPNPVTDRQIVTFGSLDPQELSEEAIVDRRLLAGKLDVFLSNLVLGQTIALLKGAGTAGSTPNGFETWRIVANKSKAEKNATAHSLMM